ncbi:MAG: homoserine kinase [Cytophagales bacterium]|nr:homoserine kinase [Cytophagales bacterium]
MDSIKVFSPASVANVACGYDIFGFALYDIGDEITLTKRNDSKLVITKVSGAELPLSPDKNVATVAISSLLERIHSTQGFDIEIHKNVNPGSGLGSSASSAAGAAFAANALLGNPFTKSELIQNAMAGEIVASQSAHADNVSPAMLGGFTIVRSCEPDVDVFQIDYPEELVILIVFPQVQVKTAEAKRMLGDTISLNKAREQWGNVAGLTAGLMKKDWGLIERSLVDVVAEPVRKNLIPHYEDVKEIALKNGALGFNISGSGPSMFSFYRNESEAKAGIDEIRDIYNRLSIDSFFHISKINPKGTHIIE